MEVNYRREAKHNYMVAGQAGETAGYEARMLAGNDIRGLLRMHIRYQEGDPLYCYDITSRQPLSRLLETRFITREEICQLLIQIHAALTGMEEYLLSEGGLMLEPEYIYVEPELFQTGLCLVPGVPGDFQENLSRLLQYILKRVNHKDRESVVLAYGLFQESLKENYGMDDLLGLIAAERKKWIGLGEEDDKQSKKKEEKGEAESGRAPVEEAGGQPGEKGGFRRQKRDPAGEEHATEEDTEEDAVRVRGEKALPVAKQVLAWLSVAVLLPAALWMFKGKETVYGLRFVLAAVDVGVFLACAAFDLWQAGKRNRTGDKTVGNPYKETGDPWRILYEDEEEEDKDKEACRHRQDGGNELQEQGKDGPEEHFQTTLLADRSGEGEPLRRLVSLNGAEEDIVISYYPFVIGKHKDLADYVLSRDTVSRFHLRIDEDKGGYTITDLNSTNGTRVKDHLLEANETAEVETGDQVYIADLGYRFN